MRESLFRRSTRTEDAARWTEEQRTTKFARGRHPPKEVSWEKLLPTHALQSAKTAQNACDRDTRADWGKGRVDVFNRRELDPNIPQQVFELSGYRTNDDYPINTELLKGRIDHVPVEGHVLGNQTY